jgi:hypothetical protein
MDVRRVNMEVRLVGFHSLINELDLPQYLIKDFSGSLKGAARNHFERLQDHLRRETPNLEARDDLDGGAQPVFAARTAFENYPEQQRRRRVQRQQRQDGSGWLSMSRTVRNEVKCRAESTFMQLGLNEADTFKSNSAINSTN